MQRSEACSKRDVLLRVASYYIILNNETGWGTPDFSHNKCRL